VSREIDERVHAEVMGKMMNCPLDQRGQVGGCVHFPAYSTDITAAFIVARRMRDQRFWLQLQDMRRFDVNEWEVEFSSAGRDGWAKAETLPLAICRAALAAVEPKP
jgi:hypothetical protein